ncbi:MAG: hypothetical protein E7774_13295 [Bradyrhizobium sp.]|nr:MAG: hypothetical protein E7774_13295 [Bradyrhizobium sp.]
MRQRLDEKRLPQPPVASPSGSLEHEFAKVSAKISEVIEQLDAPISTAEEALAVVQQELRTKAVPS